MNFKNRYKNLWHKTLNVQMPAYYENNAKLVCKYRGVEIFKLYNESYDFVFSGACIGQRAGFNKNTYQVIIDDILDGNTPVSNEVAAHLKDCGLKPLSYEQYSKDYAAGLRE